MTDPLDEVEQLTGDLEAIQRRRELAMLEAKAAGKPAQAIAAAAKISEATFYRVLATRRDQADDPGRYRQYAPSLALNQPCEGLTVAIGVNPDQSPLATLTFDDGNPVLLLLQDPHNGTADLWPVIAASVAASNARVGIYGRRPVGVRSWDLPTYLGNYGELDSHAEAPLNLLHEFESRIGRLAAGEELPPLLILIDSWKTLEVINTALVWGHEARIYLIVEAARWHPRWSGIRSTLAVSGIRNTGWPNLLDLPILRKAMPTRFGTAILTSPEGTTEILLPTHPISGSSSPPGGRIAQAL